MCSHRLLRILKEDQKKDDLDSCSKEIQTLKNGRSNNKMPKRTREVLVKELKGRYLGIKTLIVIALHLLISSSLTRSLKTLRVKKRI